MSVVGVFIIICALLAASLANSVGYLIVTQGFLHGLGAAMFYNPYIFYLDDWFIKRKGLAYGVFWSGTGVCGAIMPPAMEWALNTYGYQRTLRVWAAVLVRKPPFSPNPNERLCASSELYSQLTVCSH